MGGHVGGLFFYVFVLASYSLGGSVVISCLCSKIRAPFSIRPGGFSSSFRRCGISVSCVPGGRFSDVCGNLGGAGSGGVRRFSIHFDMGVNGTGCCVGH